MENGFSETSKHSSNIKASTSHTRVNPSILYLEVPLPHCKQFLYSPGQSQRVSGSWGLPVFKTVGTWSWWGCQPYALVALPLQEIHLALICVTGWVDPGPSWGRKDYVNENFQWPH